MGDTSPQQHSTTPDHRVPRQTLVEPAIVQTGPPKTTPPPTSMQGTGGTSRQPTSTQMRKDALLQKHGRSNSQTHVTTSSSTSTATSGNSSSNSNTRRHSHTVTHAKTRPMMRSVSNQSQEQRQQQLLQTLTTSTGSTTGSNTTKSERRSKTSSSERKRRPKFVCGDHADEEPSSDQLLHTVAHAHQSQYQRPTIHGAGRRRKSEGGEEEATEEKDRDLEHDGYHPYHPPRHKHDPYPVSPSRTHPPNHLPPQQHPIEAGVGEVSGRGQDLNAHAHAHAHAAAVSSQHGNLDLERGPNSESIPNNSQRAHLLARPSSTPPIQGKKEQQQPQQQKQPEMVAIRLTAPGDMIPATTTTTTAAVREKPSHSSEPSEVSVTQAKLTNLALEEDGHPSQHHHHEQQRQQGDRIPKDTALSHVNKDKESSGEAETRKVLEPVVHSPSTLNPAALSPTVKEAASTTAVTGAGTTSPSQQHQMHHHEPPSKRLSRLLNPSLSVTSLPSLSKTTSQPVVAIISTLHHPSESNTADNEDTLSIHSKRSPTLAQQDPQQPHPSATSSAADLVSKLLNPVAAVTLGRSRSQSSLQNMLTSAISGSPSSASSSSATSRRRHHIRHGSAASLAASIKSNPGTSSSGVSNALGFMTSPPRVSDPNVYLISRFITPTSQLSSSMPKQQQLTGSPLSTSSGNSGAGIGTGGSMAARRRLPASLRMTSSDIDLPSGSMSSNGPTGTTSSMTPTSPGAVSTYSSPEGPPISSATGTSFNSLSMTTNTSPWNPAESMSRTQQKLNLQRDSSQDDLNEEEMARRGRTHREMERIQREYRCVRMTSDPLMESMTRCLALQRRQQGDAAAGFAGGEEYSL